MRKELLIMISGFIGLMLTSSPPSVLAGEPAKFSSDVSHPVCNLIDPRVVSPEKAPENYIPFLGKAGTPEKPRVLFCVEVIEKTPNGHSQTKVISSVPDQNVKFVPSKTSIMPMITATFDGNPQGKDSWIKDGSAGGPDDNRRGLIIRLSPDHFFAFDFIGGDL